MVSYTNLILYVCVAKGTTILSEWSNGDRDLETLAAECIANTPPFHARFSHTVGKRTYSYLMDDNFVYFAIFDEDLDKAQGFWLLNCVKNAFGEIAERKTLSKASKNLTSHCLQKESNSIFRHIIALQGNFDEESNSLETACKDCRKGSLASRAADKIVSVLFKILNRKMKKRVDSETNGETKDISLQTNADMSDDGALGLSSQKNGLLMVNGGRQQAKQNWKRTACRVLVMDVFVCSILFAIWFWICHGFECIR